MKGYQGTYVYTCAGGRGCPYSLKVPQVTLQGRSPLAFQHQSPKCFRPEQEGTWTWFLSPFLAFHFPLFVSICFLILPFLFFALLLIIVSEHGAPEKPEYKEKSRDKITKYLL